MTVHSAKGLEFDVVFIIGAVDGLFPHNRSKQSPINLQEERRLFYVAITRAKTDLFILLKFPGKISFVASKDSTSSFAYGLAADSLCGARLNF